MQDTNWKTWAIIAAVLVGVTFEFIKRMPEKHSSAWDVENLRINNTSEPYSVRPNVARRPQLPTPSRVAALKDQVTREQLEAFIRKNSPQETSFEHGNKDGETKTVAAATKKKKDDDEWEEVIDPKTGKKIRRKKKKKQAQKEVKKEEVRQVKQDDPPKKEDHDVDAAAEEAIAAGLVTPPPAERPDDPFASLEEWVRRLLDRPDAAQTKRFIDMYLKRLVSAEIFYKVTEMMIEDSRPDMKRLGIMCAGLTPSIMSFQILAQVIHKERSDSTVRSDAERYLVRYTDLANMGILEGILRSPSQNYSTVVAAQKLEAAALRYLSRDRNGTGRQPTQTALAASANYFRRFVVILEGLQKSPDGSVKDQAGQTLRSLQTLLNNTQIPATAPPTAVPTQAPPTQTS